MSPCLLACSHPFLRLSYRKPSSHLDKLSHSCLPCRSYRKTNQFFLQSYFTTGRGEIYSLPSLVSFLQVFSCCSVLQNRSCQHNRLCTENTFSIIVITRPLDFLGKAPSTPLNCKIFRLAYKAVQTRQFAFLKFQFYNVVSL